MSGGPTGLRFECHRLTQTEVRTLRTAAEPHYTGKIRVWESMVRHTTIIVFEHVSNHQALLEAVLRDCPEIYDLLIDYATNSGDDYVDCRRVIA